MRCCSPIIVFLLGWGIAAAADPVVPASPLDSLVRNSPFGSVGAAGPATAESGQLEFRGMMVDKGESFFSFYEPATRKSQWVGLKEAGAPYTVQSYDSTTQTVKVLYRNQPLSLTLKRSQIIVQSQPTAGPVPVMVPGGPVVAAPSSSEEAARLAQIAEEIRRRRALRTQGTPQTPMPEGVSPSGPVPQPINSSGPGPQLNNPARPSVGNALPQEVRGGPSPRSTN